MPQLINLLIQGKSIETHLLVYDTCVHLLWLILVYHLYIEDFRFKIHLPIHVPENHLWLCGICSQIVWGHLEVIIKQDCYNITN